MAKSRLKDQLYRVRLVRWATFVKMLTGTPDCVFLWVPKTAGTSLYFWLQENIGMRKMNIQRDFRAFPGFGAVTFGHVHYPSLLYAGFVPQKFHARAYKFATVRNPYSRIVSLFNYLKKDHYQGDFSEFLEDVRLNRPAVGLYNRRGLSQSNPQADWVVGWDGRLIADQVFKVEDIDGAIESLSSRFGIEHGSTLAVRNSSQKAMKVDDLRKFGRRAYDTINEIYARDFDLFDYQRK